MATHDRKLAAVRGVVEPILAGLDLELFDLELVGGGGPRTLRVTVDRAGGVDLDAITDATRAISAPLDACAELGAPYLLEVSSPGIERPLRTPEHFRRALGATVSVRHRAGGAAERLHGTLVAAGEESCTLEVDGTPVELPYDAITSARTVFDWGPAPRPASPRRPRREQEKTRS
jgi:ribosome maturation factor RimP